MMTKKMDSVLAKLSNHEIIRKGDRAVHSRHELSIEILDCLVEIEGRSIFLKEGYSPLFDYCTRRWHYSPPKAGRFIAAARCMKNFPAVRNLLSRRRITLCGVSGIAGILTHENSNRILQVVSGKKFVEIEKIVASLKIAPKTRESIRPIGLQSPAGDRDRSADREVLFQPDRTPGNDQIDSESSDDRADQSGGHSQFDSSQEKPEHRYEIRFSASEEFCRDLERAKRVCSRSWNLEAILGRAIKDLLEKRDPERKEARRKKREARKQSKSESQAQRLGKGNSPVKSAAVSGSKSADEKESPGKVAEALPVRSRHIPAPLRDAVFNRDKGRCTYTSSLGVQCDSTAHLQIDHVTPFCRGGGHSLDDLRLLCGKHNRLAAREMSLTKR